MSREELLEAAYDKVFDAIMYGSEHYALCVLESKPVISAELPFIEDLNSVIQNLVYHCPDVEFVLQLPKTMTAV